MNLRTVIDEMSLKMILGNTNVHICLMGIMEFILTRMRML